MPRSKTDDLVKTFVAPADEVVQGILGNADRRSEETQLSPKERKLLLDARKKERARQEKAKQKAQAQGDNRSFLLLPVELKDALARIAANEGVTVSQLVTFFLFEAEASYAAGPLQKKIRDYKGVSYNPRYEHELIHPRDTERTERHSDKKAKKGWG